MLWGGYIYHNITVLTSTVTLLYKWCLLKFQKEGLLSRVLLTNVLAYMYLYSLMQDCCTEILKLCEVGSTNVLLL